MKAERLYMTLKAEKNYKRYSIKLQEIVKGIGISFIISAAIAWLLYRSLYGLLLFPLVCPVVFWKQRKEAIDKQQQQLRVEFKECIRVVTTSLYAGYSVENAFLEAEKELVCLWGSQADMCVELRYINQQVRLNTPVEKLIQNLAERSGVEEILNFGQVFGYARRSGSDFLRILKDTSDRIAQKIELEQELQTMVAAKKLEQKIMNVIPMGILCFVEITSPGFLQIMYTGVLGRVIMTIFLLVYAGAYLLSEKIVNIVVTIQ